MRKGTQETNIYTRDGDNNKLGSLNFSCDEIPLIGVVFYIIIDRYRLLI